MSRQDDEEAVMSRRAFQTLLGASGAAVLGGVSLAGCQGNGTTSLRCPYGDQTFESESALKDHLVSVHEGELRTALGSGPIECPYGDKEFDSLEALRAHIKSAHTSEVTTPDSWDVETDVVVVGYGGAGACAAIQAADAGAKVLILEKNAHGGGNTMMTSATFTVPESGRAEEAVSYLTELSDGAIETEIFEAWAETAVNHVDWLEGLGDARFDGWPFTQQFAHQHIDGSDALTGRTMVTDAAPAGAGLFDLLSGAVDERDIAVRTNTPATELVLDGRDQVRGIVAEDGDSELAIKARQGIVLTCGGFGSDEELKRHHLRLHPTPHAGNAGNTGDALRLTARTGAKRWNMNESGGCFGHEFDGQVVHSQLFLNLIVSGEPISAIMVNSDGDRFMNECGDLGGDDGAHKAFLQYDRRKDTWANIPSYLVFDESVRTAGPICPGWSADNSDEIEKGWIKTAETIAGLAEAVGLDGLPETVDAYNAAARADSPDPFGRGIKSELGPGPYYAIEGLPAIWGTFGGPKKDGDAQVLDQNDEKIPRLYVAGYASHGLNKFKYQMGTSLSDAMVFGRIAGENVAAEEPWDA